MKLTYFIFTILLTFSNTALAEKLDCEIIDPEVDNPGFFHLDIVESSAPDSRVAYSFGKGDEPTPAIDDFFQRHSDTSRILFFFREGELQYFVVNSDSEPDIYGTFADNLPLEDDGKLSIKYFTIQNFGTTIISMDCREKLSL